MSNTRAKMGYVAAADIPSKIQGGEFDAYDVIFTNDTYECYIISPNLDPMLVRSKLLLFDSIEEAEAGIVGNPEVYDGMILAVKENGKYQGCIVNGGEVSWLHDESGANYVTQEELDERLDAMNFVTKQEMDAYVRGVVAGYLAAMVPEAMEEVIGDLSDLTTDAKGTIVAAINEVDGEIESKSLTITADSIGSESVKTYTFRQGDEVIGYVDIPKDLVVSGGRVVTATPSSPIIIDGQTVTTGTYIELTISNQTEKIYINVRDLVDDYEAQPNATQVQVAVANNIISATLVNGGVGVNQLATGAVSADKLASGAVTREKLSSEVISMIGTGGDWNETDPTSGAMILNKPAIKKGGVVSSVVIGDTGGNVASGSYSEASGRLTTAIGSYSHAEGTNTTASSSGSHAEGSGTTSSADGAHAEGFRSRASGAYSHAEGSNTVASAAYSHAEGSYTTAASQYQHVSGKYNVADSSNVYAEIVGNGSADNTRSNARTLDWSGNEVLAGKLTLGADPAVAMDAVPLKLLNRENLLSILGYEDTVITVEYPAGTINTYHVLASHYAPYTFVLTPGSGTTSTYYSLLHNGSATFDTTEMASAASIVITMTSAEATSINEYFTASGSPGFVAGDYTVTWNGTSGTINGISDYTVVGLAGGVSIRAPRD